MTSLSISYPTTIITYPECANLFQVHWNHPTDGIAFQSMRCFLRQSKICEQVYKSIAKHVESEDKRIVSVVFLLNPVNLKKD
ncbi:MAG: hypothetical protein Sylvanvirus11_17 [Sylvanvirus sp.]|uniref:Uncharacterized protein n=1 Tax=Sylvanvirus sp. TaxID=2487774 RepID=A0A3G5AJH6_9VIRU|nr:MAG: hypothetical protein Sylvanvirus11_17 [Sylvanvirus sp.]